MSNCKITGQLDGHSISLEMLYAKNLKLTRECKWEVYDYR